jgi:AdoMet-dependent rRNA methyltransferase SPB1
MAFSSFRREKRKTAQRIDLKMVIPGDEGTVMQEDGLFRMKDLKGGMRDVEAVAEGEPDDVAESETDEDDDLEKRGVAKTEKYSREAGRIDKSGLFYKESDSEQEESEGSEDEEAGDLGFEGGEGEDGHGASDADESDEDGNHLLTDLDPSSKEAKRRRKADLWFEKDVFKRIEDDDDLAEEDVQGAIQAYKRRNVKILAEEMNGQAEEDSDDDENDEEEEFDVEESYKNLKKQKQGGGEAKGDFEVVPKDQAKKAKKRSKVTLTPEELALGQEMITSKKRKRELLDAGWNRYMFNERDEDLPDWFVREERLHMRPQLEPDPATVEEYRKRRKDLDVKTIKKVVEAKARKKRRAAKRMDKARKKAEALMENPDVGSREKAREIQRMYKRAAAEKKKETTYVVARKHTAAKRAKRPAGVKGMYKQVDPRMKKDSQQRRGNATSKRVQKRRLKGKKTRPTRT